MRFADIGASTCNRSWLQRVVRQDSAGNFNFLLPHPALTALQAVQFFLHCIELFLDFPATTLNNFVLHALFPQRFYCFFTAGERSL